MQVFFIHIFDNLSTLINTYILNTSVSVSYTAIFKGNFVDKEA